MLMILLRSWPADCAEGMGYVSRTVMLPGVWPDLRRWRAVEAPIVPPPPTTMTLVDFREVAILLSITLGVAFTVNNYWGEIKEIPRSVKRYR